MESFSKAEGGKKVSYINCRSDGNPTQNVSKDRDKDDIHKMMATKRYNRLSLEMSAPPPDKANPLFKKTNNRDISKGERTGKNSAPGNNQLVEHINIRQDPLQIKKNKGYFTEISGLVLSYGNIN